MAHTAGLGLYIESARFVQGHILFKDREPTKERVVDCYELVLFLENGGASVVNGKKYAVEAGCVRFYRPGDRVYSYRFGDIYVTHFRVDDPVKGEELFEEFPRFMALPDMEMEKDLFKEMMEAYVGKDDLECTRCLWNLLGRIREQFRLQQKGSRKAISYQIKSYLDHHCHEKITLEEIAQKVHLHPVYLQRKFKKEMGISPMEYLKEVRIAKAKTFLLTTDLSNEEIAERCGFYNGSHFIQTFRKREGITPYQYRHKDNAGEIHI